VHKVISFFLVAATAISIAACGSSEKNPAEAPIPEVAVVEQAVALPTPTETPVAMAGIIEEDAMKAEEAVSQPVTTDAAVQEAAVVEQATGSDYHAEDATVGADNSEILSEPAEEPLADAEAITANAVEFTAGTGLGDFSAYRMTFATEFDGTRAGQPTQGTLGGLMEITKNPAAQHWQINMDGNAFSNLSLLGGGMEMYDVANTIYIQNPGDGSWIGMPAMLVQSMLPSEMYNPEDNIDLPATAVLQGEETVNGVLTNRYTFGRDDLSGDVSKLEQIDGTVWVAVEGNYVVKYEAVVSGEFDNLTAGDMTVLDEGTITMMYEIGDVDGDLTIAPPAGAKAIDLTSLLFN
jgi:predicted small lipoprotein YifL